MRIAAMVAAMMMAGEAGAASSWKFLFYEGFVESVDVLAGPDATDCGFLDRRELELPAERLRTAVDCVRDALVARRPFKFATVAPGSNVGYVLLRATSSELWTVRYARWVANRHLHEEHINQTCEYVLIDEASLQIHGVNCRLVSDGALPTHVRANPGH